MNALRGESGKLQLIEDQLLRLIDSLACGGSQESATINHSSANILALGVLGKGSRGPAINSHCDNYGNRAIN